MIKVKTLGRSFGSRTAFANWSADLVGIAADFLIDRVRLVL